MPSSIPRPQKPNLSGYIESDKLLPWGWAEYRLQKARNYWITTHSSSTYPHARPVWGIWTENSLLFSTGGLIGRHVGLNDRVQINLESGDEVVLLEGQVKVLKDPATLSTWISLYKDKYNWDVSEQPGDVFQVHPKRALAWMCDNSGRDDGMLFSNTATEWRFEGA